MNAPCRSLALLSLFLCHAAAWAEEPPAEQLPPAPAGKVWKLVWQDEFNGTELDTTKWEIPPAGVRRDGWWMPQAIRLDGQGHLLLSVLKEGDKYLDGCVRTRGKFERAFGYYTARIQLHHEPGHWPAFWMMGAGVMNTAGEGRDGTEIDIMEKPWRDEQLNHALHWNGYGAEHRSAGQIVRVLGVMEGFHTFSLWWTPEEYVFFVDGRETWRTNAGGVCQVPLYLKLSDEIGPWGGDIRQAQLPDQTVVDYVRVYDLVPSP